MNEKSNIDRLNMMINELKGDVSIIRANNKMILRLGNCIENIDKKICKVEKKMTDITNSMKSISVQIIKSNRELIALRKKNASLGKKLKKSLSE